MAPSTLSEPAVYRSAVPPFLRTGRGREGVAILFLAILPLLLVPRLVTGSQALVPAGQLEHFPAWKEGAAAPPPWDVLYWDDLCQLLPWQKNALRTLAAGRVPLWNHQQACGMPLLANSQTSALSPYWLVLQMGGLIRAQGWMAIFQLWIAGWGTYAFFRFHRLRRLPALLAGCVYQLSGWSLCWLEFPNRHAPEAWFPLCLWLTARARAGGLRWRILAPLAIAVSLLSGHLQFEFYLVFGLAVYAGVNLLLAGGLACSAGEDAKQLSRSAGGRRTRDRSAGMIPFLAVVLAGCLLAAPQLLPSAELGRWSSRVAEISWQGYTQRMQFSMPSWWLAQSFVPGFFGYPANPPGSGGMTVFASPGVPPVVHFPGDFYEYCVFVGIIPLLMAIQGLRRGRQQDPLAIFLVALGATGLLLATGTLLNAALYFTLPGFNGIAGTARMLFWFAFAAAGLAGVGLNELLTPAAVGGKTGPAAYARSGGERQPGVVPAPRKVSSGRGGSAWRAVGVTGMDAGLILLFGAAFCVSGALALSSLGAEPGAALSDVLEERMSGTVISLVFLILGSGAILALRLRVKSRHIPALALLGLCCAQLLLFGENVVQTAPPGAVFPASGVVRAIQARRPFRLMNAAHGWTLGRPAGEASRAGGPEELRRPAVLPPNTSAYYGDGDRLTQLESYDSLNTRAYTDYCAKLQGGPAAPPQNGNMVLLSNVDSPLVRLAGVDLVVSSVPVRSGTLTAAGEAGDVYFYRVPGTRPPALVEPPRGSPPIVERWDAGEIDLQGVVGPGRLVVLDAAAPGWAAKVDGTAAAIETSDGLFKAVEVGTGRHRVEMEYRPVSFRLGVFLSALCVASLLSLGAWGWVRNGSWKR